MVSGTGPVVAGFVCASVALVFVSLRLYTRAFISHGLGYDDVLVAISFVFAAAEAPLMVYQYRYGMGRHIQDIATPALIDQERIFWASTWIYILGILFAKLGILAQYLRIFTTRKTRLVTWSMIAFVAICCSICLIIEFLMCVPIAKFWEPQSKGKCIDFYDVWYLMAAMNIFSDFGIIAIPIPSVVRMQMPLRQRINLSLTFAMGGFGCVASMVRLYYIAFLHGKPDITFYNANAALWSIMELNIIIVCACMIALHTLLAQCMKTMRHRLAHRSSWYTKGSKSGSGSNHGPEGPSRSRRVSRRVTRIWAGKPDIDISASAFSGMSTQNMFQGTPCSEDQDRKQSVGGLSVDECLCGDAINVVTRIDVEAIRSSRVGSLDLLALPELQSECYSDAREVKDVDPAHLV